MLRVMDAQSPPSLDAVRITQRFLKFVLVPIAFVVGLVLVGVQVARDRSELDFLYRMAVAAVLGGLIGVERQLSGHWAGLRTHMMVSLASALFMIAGNRAGSNGDATRVIQGIAAGIGFLGA